MCGCSRQLFWMHLTTAQQHVTSSSLLRDLRLEGGVFGEAAKVGLECLRPVSEALASSEAPGSGEVQKLVFVMQLIEKMADLFASGGFDGGYSHQEIQSAIQIDINLFHE